MRPIRFTTLTLTACLGLTACTPTEGKEPVTSVENCGQTVEFGAAPERVTLLHSAPIPTLEALGVLDHVTAKAGVFPTSYYDGGLAERVSAIPAISDRVDSSGHLQISREEVVAQDPDLVLGSTDTVNGATMASSGVPVIDEPAFCGSLEGPASFEDAWEQIHLYGTIFDREEEASKYIDHLIDRLPENPDRQLTGAVLYPTSDGGITYAYGAGSMATPVLDAAGVTNVFVDASERVFEVSAEEIVGRNPDFILVLHSGEPDAERAVTAVEALPGIETTDALVDGRVMPLLLNFAEPPTPLAVDGVARIDAFLKSNP